MVYCVYVDVLRRPEEEFWRSTLREIYRRWDAFATLKGWRDPTAQVQEFDDN